MSISTLYPQKEVLVKVRRSNETLGKTELDFSMYLTGTFDFGLR